MNNMNMKRFLAALLVGTVSAAAPAEIYTSEGFLSTKMATEGNFGARCHEIIKLNRLMFEDTKGGVSHE